MTSRTLCFTFAVISAMTALPLSPLLALEADFAGGNGTSTVDAYVGQSGGGWATAWTNQTNAATVSGSVASASPLDGEGNYLAVTVTSTSTNTADKQGFVTRAFDGSASGIDVTKPVTYTFLFRPDSTLGSGQAYVMFDNVGGAATGTGPNNTWGIVTSTTNTWTFWGSSTIDSGMAVTAGHTYRFTIAADPGTSSYIAAVADLTAGTTYTSERIGFRYRTTAVDGTYLQFGARAAASGTTVATLHYSLDALSVTPGIEGAASTYLSRYGVNASLNHYADDYQTFCDQVIASGVKWVRVGATWNGIEPSKGGYSTAVLAQMDDVVNRLNNAGVGIVWVLGYTAIWASSQPTVAPSDTANVTYYPPTNQSDWDSFVNFISTRYKGKVNYWEVWNEEDGGGFWKGSVSDYYTLLQTAATRLRSVSSANKVLIGGLADPTTSFFSSLLSMGGGSYFDIVNYHVYGESARHVTMYNATTSTMATYGLSARKIWLTETGYTTGGSAPLEANKADYIDQVQAAYARWPNVERVLFYEYRNDDSGVNINEQNFGLVADDLTPLPALAHYQAIGQAETDFGLERNYAAVTPDTLTLYYNPVTTGDGSHVTFYDATDLAMRVASGTYMYFKVNDNWLYDSNGGLDPTVSVDVTYLDTGTGSWALQYDGQSNAYTSQSATRAGTGAWVTKTFTLADVKFANRENGATDLRLSAGGADLIVGKVAIRKEPYTARVIIGTPDLFKLMTRIVDTNTADIGYDPVVTQGGVPCGEIAGNSNYLFFQVAQGLVRVGDTNVQFGITFWDGGTDTLRLQYQSTSSLYQTVAITKTNTNTWRHVVIPVTDAAFNHGMSYHADFCLGNAGDGSVEYVSEVDVTVAY